MEPGETDPALSAGGVVAGRQELHQTAAWRAPSPAVSPLDASDDAHPGGATVPALQGRAARLRRQDKWADWMQGISLMPKGALASQPWVALPPPFWRGHVRLPAMRGVLGVWRRALKGRRQGPAGLLSMAAAPDLTRSQFQGEEQRSAPPRRAERQEMQREALPGGFPPLPLAAVAQALTEAAQLPFAHRL
jgi:hypothetical protein